VANISVLHIQEDACSFDLFADRNATSAVIGPLNDVKGKVAGGSGVRQLEVPRELSIGVHDPGALDRPIHPMRFEAGSRGADDCCPEFASVYDEETTRSFDGEI